MSTPIDVDKGSQQKPDVHTPQLPTTPAIVDPDFIVGSNRLIYDHYFDMCDIDRSGIVGALEAALLLRRSQLADALLGKIWDMADSDYNGVLDREQFVIALKLVALAQQSKSVSTDQLHESGMRPPDFGPVNPSHMTKSAPCTLARLIQAERKFRGSATKVGVSDRWVVLAEQAGEMLAVDVSEDLDRNMFSVLFLNLPQSAVKDEHFIQLNGRFGAMFDSLVKPPVTRLSGGECREIMSDSNLPTDTLAKIWAQCDANCVGSLDRDAFIKAMRMVHLAFRPEPDGSVGALRIEINRAEYINRRLNDQLNVIRKRVVEKKSELTRLESELELTQSSVAELHNAKTQEITRLEKARVKSTDMAEKLSRLETEKKNVKTQIKERYEKIMCLRAAEAEYDTHRQKVRNKVSALKAQISNTQQHIEKDLRNKLQQIGVEMQHTDEKIIAENKLISSLSKLAAEMNNVADTTLPIEDGSAVIAQIQNCISLKKLLASSACLAPGTMVSDDSLFRSFTPNPPGSEQPESGQLGAVQKIRAKSSLDFVFDDNDMFDFKK